MTKIYCVAIPPDLILHQILENVKENFFQIIWGI